MALVETIAATKNSPRKIRVKSPLNHEVIGEVSVQTEAQVREAVVRAREAQKEWALRPIKERARYVQRAIDVVLQRQDELIDVIVKDTGRSRLETLMMEILAVCDGLNHWSRQAEKQLSDRKLGTGLLFKTKKLRMIYKPLGVVGIITPWNGPFVMGMDPTCQALLAGNAVILKPSEVTPFAGRLVKSVFEDAGLPPDLLQVVDGDGETGAALVEAGVDKISFTGSTRTGRKVGEICGRNLVPCSLELGGKDPMIVCADADIERAAGGAVFGAMFNTGQYCSSMERCYVVESQAERFIQICVDKVKGLRMAADGHYDIAPMIWDRQLEVIERHVADAVKKGAKVLVGGQRDGQFFQPTVITDVSHDMLIMTEETFGPVLPIMRVANEEEALKLANDCIYGLSGTIWSKDENRAMAMARRLETGNITINDSSFSYGIPQSPFGGVKNSGVGQVHGETGLRRYAQELPIVIDRFGPKQEQAWYPYDEKKWDGMKKALKVLFGSPLRRIV